jgi:hypothetical protein
MIRSGKETHALLCAPRAQRAGNAKNLIEAISGCDQPPKVDEDVALFSGSSSPW